MSENLATLLCSIQKIEELTKIKAKIRIHNEQDKQNKAPEIVLKLIPLFKNNLRFHFAKSQNNT